jgi:hypothetical protein
VSELRRLAARLGAALARKIEGEVVQREERERLLLCVLGREVFLRNLVVRILFENIYWLEMDRRLLGLVKILISHRA